MTRSSGHAGNSRIRSGEPRARSSSTVGEPIGTVTQLDSSGEFGFIETADGEEIYFHRNSVLGDEFAQLQVGSRVTFAEKVGDKGPMASTVKLLGKHGLRT